MSRIRLLQAFTLATTVRPGQHSAMPDRHAELVETLRHRIVRGLHAGTLAAGDRLPSARELEQEFDVDHRVVLAAYRDLVGEGLVELRQRGGIYVGAAARAGTLPMPAEPWIVRLLTEGIAREVPIVELHDWLRRAVDTRRLRAAVIQGSADQIVGMCRELRDDYGLEATGVDAEPLAGALAAALTNAGELPAEIRRADLLVTTEGFERLGRAVAELARKPVIVATVRPDLIGGEWRLLLRKPVYVIVADARFEALLGQFFADTPGVQNLRIFVVERDDPRTIPAGAPGYVTRGARERLGGTALHGRVLPTARIFSSDSARELVAFIVRANFAALAASP